MDAAKPPGAPLRTFLLLGFWFLASATRAQAPDERVLFRRMITAIDDIRTLTCTMERSERIGGRMVTGSQALKLSTRPFKVYLKMMAPDAGTEVLFVEGANGGKARVNPSRMPGKALNLDPDAGLLRKGRHHSVREIGLSYLGGILKNVYDRYADHIEEWMRIKGEVTHDGRKCWVVELTNGNYALHDVAMRPGENVIGLARRTFTNEHELLELNGLRSYDVTGPGRTLKVPDTYFKSIELHVDQATFIPVYQKIFDAKGVIATYDLKNVRLNPVIAPEEFTPSYKEYGF